MFVRKNFILSIVLILLTTFTLVNAQQNDVLEFSLIRDEESLTVYVPEGETGSLVNVAFEVSANDQVRGYALDDSALLAFDGFDFSQVQGPICFRLEKTGSLLPPPMECSNLEASQKLTQQLPAANIFWYDETAKIGLLINVVRGSDELGRCPGVEPICPIRIPQDIFVDVFNGASLKSHWNVEEFPADLYEVEDGRLHITATNNTERWQQWDMKLELDHTYVNAHAEFELVRAEGGEVSIGMGGTTLDDRGCFAVGLWANESRYRNEQRGYSEVGEVSSDSTVSCQDVMDSSIYRDFEWTQPTVLGVDLSSSSLQLLRNGGLVKSSALGTGSTIFIRIQLDVGASLEGYIDNFTVKYSSDIGDPPPTSPPPPTGIPITVNSNAKIRGGPGQNYFNHSILGAGEQSEATCKDASGQWLCLGFANWTHSSLVTINGNIDDLPVYSPPSPVMIASFDSCNEINNIGGGMGPFSETNSRMSVKFIPESDTDSCQLSLSYSHSETGFSGYWIMILGADYLPYTHLVFDVRADKPTSMKVELKIGGDAYEQVFNTTASSEWQTISTPLDLSYGGLLELVFVFEANNSGQSGTVYIDNIQFEKRD